jgi:hypothetical protein
LRRHQIGELAVRLDQLVAGVELIDRERGIGSGTRPRGNVLAQPRAIFPGANMTAATAWPTDTASYRIK